MERADPWYLRISYRHIYNLQSLLICKWSCSSIIYRNLSFWTYFNLALLFSTALVLNSFPEMINSLYEKWSMNLLKIEKAINSWYEGWDKKQTFAWKVVLETPGFSKVRKSDLFRCWAVVCWCWVKEIKIQEDNFHYHFLDHTLTQRHSIELSLYSISIPHSSTSQLYKFGIVISPL